MFHPIDTSISVERPDDQVLTVITSILPPDIRTLERFRRATRSVWPTVAKAATRRIGAAAAALDGFCGRMKDGLAAFALILALGLTVTAVVRHPETFLPPPDADADLAAGHVLTP